MLLGAAVLGTGRVAESVEIVGQGFIEFVFGHLGYFEPSSPVVIVAAG